jgi:glycine betaine catabolism A
MGFEPQTTVSASAAKRRHGYSLPQEFYVSREIFECDLDVFFHRHWIVVGLEIDIPEEGDVFKVDIGKTSILLVRDDDGAARAFHNVCRHRGARLVDEGKTSVGRLVCPYHQWTYDLNGDLAYAAHMGANLDKGALGLKPVHLKSIGGILMVCLAEEAPDDIDAVAAIMEPRLKPYDLGNAKIAHEIDLVEKGNWKLAIDNNRECYHCSGSHPELGNSLNVLDIGFDPAELTSEQLTEFEVHKRTMEAETAKWEAEGYPSSLVERMADCATLLRTQRFAIEGAGESHTLDTNSACRKLLGAVPAKRFGDLHLWTHNSWHHFLSDHAVVTHLIPLSPGETLVRTRWLVHRDAVEGVDYDLARLIEVWKATNQQDADLVARAQKGVESTGYAPGPLSTYTERLVDLNVRWYLDRLGVHAG